jgi:galactose-1-phosphate uridylyltransferase
MNSKFVCSFFFENSTNPWNFHPDTTPLDTFCALQQKNMRRTPEIDVLMQKFSLLFGTNVCFQVAMQAMLPEMPLK